MKSETLYRCHTCRQWFAVRGEAAALKRPWCSSACNPTPKPLRVRKGRPTKQDWIAVHERVRELAADMVASPLTAAAYAAANGISQHRVYCVRQGRLHADISGFTKRRQTGPALGYKKAAKSPEGWQAERAAAAPAREEHGAG